METVQVKIYNASELSKKALSKAHHEWQCLGMYPWNSENEAVLNEFAEAFGLNITSWQYGNDRGVHVRFEFNDYLEFDPEEMNGIRLLKWIMNNHFDTIYTGKYYHKGKASKHSKVFFEYNTLAGYCVGYDILKPIFDFIENPTEQDLNGLIKECLNAWLTSCNSDYEYYYSEESFIENSEANEWKYTEDGSFFNF